MFHYKMAAYLLLFSRLKNKSSEFLLLTVVVSLLSSCGGVKDGPPASYNRDWNEIEDAVPRDEPHSKYGNPASYEVFGKKYFVRNNNSNFTESGVASWYGSKFHGQRTSSGETYDMYAMTAAHKSLRLPVYVEVTNKKNGRKAIVKVNDRGPFHEGRIIDLSYAAATKLGVAATGTAPVSIRVVTSAEPLEESTDEEIIKVVDGSVKTIDGQVASTQSAQINPAYTFEGGKVYVQIAAFGTEKNALDMLDKLRQKNFSGTRIHVENENGKLLYRVRIGPLPTETVAEKLVSQLKDVNHHNAKIITYN